MNTLKIFLITALLTAVTLTAYGQQQPTSIQPGEQGDDVNVTQSGRMGRNGPRSGGKREEVRKKIEAVRIWRLNEALKLDPATSAKLSSILSSFHRQRRDIRRVQMRTMRTLKLAIKSQKPDESKIKVNLETLEKNQHAMQELRNNELRALKDILTIEQQARYIVFQKKFMREMRSMINDARGNKRGRTGMRSGGNRMQGDPGEPPED